MDDSGLASAGASDECVTLPGFKCEADSSYRGVFLLFQRIQRCPPVFIVRFIIVVRFLFARRIRKHHVFKFDTSGVPEWPYRMLAEFYVGFQVDEVEEPKNRGIHGYHVPLDMADIRQFSECASGPPNDGYEKAVCVRATVREVAAYHYHGEVRRDVDELTSVEVPE